MQGTAHFAVFTSRNGNLHWASVQRLCCLPLCTDCALIWTVAFELQAATYFLVHSSVLLFRFTVCDICEQFKAQLHDPATPLAEKLGCVKSYRNHLRSQYTDRSLLWQLCDLSYAREGDLMCIWIDGMEQSKFQVPRSRGLKTASATLLGFDPVARYIFCSDCESEGCCNGE